MPPRSNRSLPELAGALALNLAETCAVTGLGEKTIIGEIQARRLKSRVIARKRIILVSDIRRWLEGLPMANDGDNATPEAEKKTACSVPHQDCAPAADPAPDPDAATPLVAAVAKKAVR